METTAVNKLAEEETGAKITRKMQTDKTGVIGADPAENKTSQVTYVTLVPRGNETLRRNARGTPSALSSSESYV